MALETMPAIVLAASGVAIAGASLFLARRNRLRAGQAFRHARLVEDAATMSDNVPVILIPGQGGEWMLSSLVATSLSFNPGLQPRPMSDWLAGCEHAPWPELSAKLQQALESRSPVALDWSRKTPDGPTRYLQLQAGFSTAADGLAGQILDVSEQKEAENNRETAREEAVRRLHQLRAVFDNVPIGLRMMDEDLNYIAWNRNFLKLCDLAEEDVKASPSYPAMMRLMAERGDFDHIRLQGNDYAPEDISRFPCLMTLLEAQKNRSLNEPMTREEIDAYVDWACLPFHPEMWPPQESPPPVHIMSSSHTGRILERHDSCVPSVGWVSVYIDVTERRHAQERIQQQNIRLRSQTHRLALAEKVARIGHWRWQVATDSLELSANARRILMAPEGDINDDVPLRDWARLFSSENTPSFRVALNRTLNSGNTLESVLYLPLPDGRDRIVKVIGHPEIDDDGRPESVFGVVIDETAFRHREQDLENARKQLEMQSEELRQAATRLQSNHETLDLAIRATGAGIWDSDLVNSIMHWSPEAYRLLGYQPDSFEITDRMVLALVHPDDRRDFSEAFQRFLKGTDPGFRAEARFRSARGEYHWIAIYGRAMRNSDGRATRSTGLMLDITEAKQFEARLARQRDELDRLNDQKTRFFSVLAHDLKNPFNSLIGFSALLNLRLEDQDLDMTRLRDYARLIETSTHELHDLLQNLLEWAQLQMDGYRFVPEVIDLHEAASRTVRLFSGLAREKDITIHNRVLRIALNADRNMIDALLRNLVSNAIKFTPGSGTITISAFDDGDVVRLSVADTGVGIETGKLDSLFMPGEQSSTPGTRGETGTGLGLMLCKEYAEAHKGSIEVKSYPAQGTTFTVSLPSLNRKSSFFKNGI